jgi:hypothetical protein
MRLHVIVLAEPRIDNDLYLPDSCEPLGVVHRGLPPVTVPVLKLESGRHRPASGLVDAYRRSVQMLGAGKEALQSLVVCKVRHHREAKKSHDDHKVYAIVSLTVFIRYT